MLIEGKNKSNIPELLSNNQRKKLKIFNAFFNSYFNEPASEKLKSIILESSNINKELEDCIRIPLNFNSYNELVDEILFINSLIREDFEKIIGDNHKKIIFIGEKSNEEFDALLQKSIENFGEYPDLSYLYACLQKHRQYRYLSYNDLLNKEMIRCLYTENDHFFDGFDSEIETFVNNLENMVQDCMARLSKFDSFSFEYSYDEHNDDELSNEIKDIFNNFNDKFPGFFCAPDELLNFLKYQVRRLIKKSEKKDIEEVFLPLKFEILTAGGYYDIVDDPEIFDHKNNDEIQIDENIGSNVKQPDNIDDIKTETTNEIFGTFYFLQPPLNYDDLSDIIKNKLNEVKNKYPKYFFSGKDVLYYLEGIWSTDESGRLSTNGVFCDIDGTLVVDGHINIKIIEKLIYYYKEGKHIQLWTAGNIYNKNKLLNNLLPEFQKLGISLNDLLAMGIICSYPLKNPGEIINWNIVNKYDYEGLQPEIVIDDWNYKKFIYILDIIPKKFINVSDL